MRKVPIVIVSSPEFEINILKARKQKGMEKCLGNSNQDSLRTSLLLINSIVPILVGSIKDPLLFTTLKKVPEKAWHGSFFISAVC